MPKPRISTHLTARDQAILSFINDFGFCEMPQLDRRFHWRHSQNYKVMRRLIRAGYVVHQRLLYHRPGVYRLTRKGALCTALPALQGVPLANYEHTRNVIAVYLTLRTQYPAATWVSERQLMQEKYRIGVGQKGHVPDGLLLLPDGKTVAIEVELTAKSPARLQKILNDYRGMWDEIQAVWYIVKETLYPTYSKLTEPFARITCFPLTEFLNI